MGLYDFTLNDLIIRNAAVYGDNLAWFECDDKRSLTFNQVRDQSAQVAAGLQNAGVSKGDRIGVIGKNSLEYFLVYGAAAMCGAIVLPINWRLSSDEVLYNLNDCSPVVLFADEEYQGLVNEHREALASVSTVFNLGKDAGGATSFASLLKTDARLTPPEIQEDDGFVIIHTAAVAGRPRGALLSHGNVICANLHMNYGLSLTAADVHLNLLPMFHVGGLFMATNAFHAGAANINMSKFGASQATALIRDKSVSVLFDFSPILGSILEAAENDGVDIGSLQKVIGLEAPDTIEAYEKITGGTFFAMYGQTETSCLATLSPYRERPGSAGRPIPLMDIRLVDEADRPVPMGATGEIAVRGPMVFRGYWNLDEDNAETFRNGWHHTGDMGKFDADGYLFYAGRKPEKELIKPGGENVYPAEVEKVILEHPAVNQTVVFGVPDMKWKEGIKAVCVLEPGQSLAAEELIAFVGERIARYKKPQYVEFANALPVTDSGDLDRAAVKETYGGAQG
jgi:long-chain acyl-CoA synthetase